MYKSRSQSRPLTIAFVVAAASMLCPTADAHAADSNVRPLVDNPDSWFAGDAGKAAVANVISYQTPIGGWAKGYDVSKPRKAGGEFGEWGGVATYDNNATVFEMRLLARAARVNDDAASREAFYRGLEFVRTSQYPNGGWPQRFPVPKNYGSHITYNDNAMTSILRLLMDAAGGTSPDFVFVDAPRRAAARATFDRGIACVLATQIVRDGKPTGWCQQHDEATLLPTDGRAYELASVSGGESAGVVLLLMELPDPDAKVRAAVDGAAAWFESARVAGKRYEKGKDAAGKSARLLVDDPAGVVWARFYDLKTNKPFFCDRDGRALDSVDQLPAERRNGYAWYGNWGDGVEKAYARWKARQPTTSPGAK